MIVVLLLLPAEVAVGEANHVVGFVGQQREGDDQALVALTASDGALEQTLSEELQDPIVTSPSELHPRVDAQERVVR